MAGLDCRLTLAVVLFEQPIGAPVCPSPFNRPAIPARARPGLTDHARSQIMTAGLYQTTILALLKAPRLRKRLSAIASRKAALLEPLRASEDPEAIQKRIEKGLEGVARRMAEEMAARIESPRLIRCVRELQACWPEYM